VRYLETKIDAIYPHSRVALDLALFRNSIRQLRDNRLGSSREMRSKDMDLPSYNIEQLNVLGIDSNLFDRQILRSVLHALNVRNVRQTSDVVSGSRLLRTYPFDILITELDTLPIDGLRFLHELRSDINSPKRYIPVIVLTARSTQKDVELCRDLGAHEFLAKPYSPLGLYARICSIIGGAREFIETERYFGPDRRRQSLPTAAERRIASPNHLVTEEEVKLLLTG
jgi:two-component system chemotaxis response regulator CheY